MVTGEAASVVGSATAGASDTATSEVLTILGYARGYRGYHAGGGQTPATMGTEHPITPDTPVTPVTGTHEGPIQLTPRHPTLPISRK